MGTLAVLHPVFALTGIVLAIHGPLMPSIAATFHLNDSQSGLLFLMFFSGCPLGALFCRGNYARAMVLGFLVQGVSCIGVAFAGPLLLAPAFLILGVGAGIGMSAVTLFAGRNFAARLAPALTWLNFSWSAGALTAPLLAAQILRTSLPPAQVYRLAYLLLAGASALAALACGVMLADAPEAERLAVVPTAETGPAHALLLIALFAFLTFLEVGIEDTAAAWFATYSLRSASGDVALAAASSALYWCGFLGSRGLSSLLLLRIKPMHLLRIAVATGLAASVLLTAFSAPAVRAPAMLLLGASLAPIFPLLLSTFFARARHTSDSRYVLAICGFGGSVLPWLTGLISARSGNLRLGLMTIPATLLVIALMLPVVTGRRGTHGESVLDAD
jgi:fucose permease